MSKGELVPIGGAPRLWRPGLVANNLGAVAELRQRRRGGPAARPRDDRGAFAENLQPGRPWDVEGHLLAFAVGPSDTAKAPRPGGATKPIRARQRRG
jgi:hypothetical protein